MDSPRGPELRLAGLSVPFCVDDGGVISARVPEVSNMRLVGYNDLQALPPAINFDAIFRPRSARNATALNPPLRVRLRRLCSWRSRAWRPSSCADGVHLPALFNAAVR